MADETGRDNKTKHVGEEVRRQVRERTMGYVVGALGLVAGLAWNDFIATVIGVLFPLQKDTIPAKFLYALVITVVVVVFTIYLTKLISKNSPQE